MTQFNYPICNGSFPNLELNLEPIYCQLLDWSTFSPRNLKDETFKIVRGITLQSSKTSSRDKRGYRERPSMNKSNPDIQLCRQSILCSNFYPFSLLTTGNHQGTTIIGRSNPSRDTTTPASRDTLEPTNDKLTARDRFHPAGTPNRRPPTIQQDSSVGSVHTIAPCEVSRNCREFNLKLRDKSVRRPSIKMESRHLNRRRRRQRLHGAVLEHPFIWSAIRIERASVILCPIAERGLATFNCDCRRLPAGYGAQYFPRNESDLSVTAANQPVQCLSDVKLFIGNYSLLAEV